MGKINLFFFRVSVFLNIVLIVGIAFNANKLQTNSTKAAVKSHDIVLLENPITAGGKWSEILNRTNIRNSGVCGSVTPQLLWNIKISVLQYKPKICFVEGGIYDTGLEIPLMLTYKFYRLVVDTLLSYKIVPVLKST
jgi:hypothetical protein